MATNYISPKTWKLLNQVTDNVPGLDTSELDYAFNRLSYILESDTHKSFGTYIKCGSATSVQCLDGSLDADERNEVANLISLTTDLQEVNGYYFIHEGDEPGLDIYSHYCIEL